MKTKIIAILFAAILISLFFFKIWKIPIYMQLESIKLPENCEVLYKSRVEFSDVYEDKILGEKVIKCDLGFEEVKKYIEENNLDSSLKYITVGEYFGMSDDAIYFSDFDENFDPIKMTSEECDKYIKIRYCKKNFGMPWHYIDIFI